MGFFLHTHGVFFTHGARLQGRPIRLLNLSRLPSAICTAGHKEAEPLSRSRFPFFPLAAHGQSLGPQRRAHRTSVGSPTAHTDRSRLGEKMYFKRQTEEDGSGAELVAVQPLSCDRPRPGTNSFLI